MLFDHQSPENVKLFDPQWARPPVCVWPFCKARLPARSSSHPEDAERIWQAGMRSGLAGCILWQARQPGATGSN